MTRIENEKWLSDQELATKAEELLTLAKTKLAASPQFSATVMEAYFAGFPDDVLHLGDLDIKLSRDRDQQKLVMTLHQYPNNANMPAHEMISIRFSPGLQFVAEPSGNFQYFREPFEPNSATIYTGCLEGYDAVKKFLEDNL